MFRIRGLLHPRAIFGAAADLKELGLGHEDG
jgi:hypothetical protein